MSNNPDIARIQTASGDFLEVNFRTKEISHVNGQSYGSRQVIAKIPKGVAEGDPIPAGSIDFSELPEADPEIAGQMWSNEGVLTISAGPIE